ncbi:lipopolysaccharide assembly protein LapA domain-containing protein [Pseudomonas sp. TNT3]|uniref:lipopolysaccharide assembly protein LapA domain-containing protein n=1 Tax=Pseudomonas sp. TNT3 TaxID=2654097 RepID=UPI0013920AD4|nr:lipopolysaccharide assembly protein LapA domain-containing protein [Pseudomonas sp. TNT3]KAI2694283.1 lipopolysaccharide assembly protein LapA domain-containing protein [Pseudomonas sp. TNT3]
MRRFKRVALAALVSLLIFLVVIFVLENRQPTSLVFFGWSSVQMPVAGYVVLALLLGMIMGPLLAWLFGRRTGLRS